MSNIVAIVPSRLGSSRFPGKPLKKIHGMPMIGHCYHRASMAQGINEAYVATCDKEIYEYILSIGGNVIMTSKSHTRAVTRSAEALENIEKKTGQKIDIAVMVQGDEPLIHPDVISETIPHFKDSSVNIVNIISHLRTKEEFESKNNVKVVTNKDSDIIYYSREPIPSPWHGWEKLPRFQQTGIIAFRRNALIDFYKTPETTLEKIEFVDMNRVIETGGKVRAVLTQSRTLGVDIPEDILTAEELLKDDLIMHKYL